MCVNLHCKNQIRTISWHLFSLERNFCIPDQILGSPKAKSCSEEEKKKKKTLRFLKFFSPQKMFCFVLFFLMWAEEVPPQRIQIIELWLWGLAADGSEWRVRGEELGWWETNRRRRRLGIWSDGGRGTRGPRLSFLTGFPRQSSEVSSAGSVQSG